MKTGRMKWLLWVCCAVCLKPALMAQALDYTASRAEVDFSIKLRAWDGFGFNYVQTCQTFNLEKHHQDLGGFSLLDEKKKQEIIDLVFGDDGLKVGVVKLFLDPFHQTEKGGAFDHKHSTEQLRYFARQGYEKAKSCGRELSMITTLYGPPAYLTEQKVFRGRNIDPELKGEMADYITDWARFLIQDEKLPLKYVSLHNEGESWMRWEVDGITQESNNTGHDYNLFWSPELVAEFLSLLPKHLKKAGIGHVAVAPGETYGWDRFYRWGYARKIRNDKNALKQIGLITSHGFYMPGYERWNCDHTSAGVDLIREARPDLHVWTTSNSWGNMGSSFVRDIYGTIYTAKSNAVIPWAGIQVPEAWYGYDPNKGCAVWVHENNSYELRKGYYFYKQVTRAGQPGMAVASTFVMDSDIAIMAFAQNGTENPDAMVLINTSGVPRTLHIKVIGSEAAAFKGYRSSDHSDRRANIAVERFSEIGRYPVEKGSMTYQIPAKSVTTFFGE